MSKTTTTSVDRFGNEQLFTKARESAGKLWLFGLGAYSLASRSGVQACAALVREGKALRPKARRQIEETSAELVNGASASIERGSKLFRVRLLQPLSCLAVASKRDIEQLAKRLQQLTAEVRKLTSGADAPTAEARSETSGVKPLAQAPAAEAAPALAGVS